MWIERLSKACLVLCLLLVGSVARAETRSGETVTIAENEAIDDDLYIFARTIVVDGSVAGDLIVFGQHVTVGGTIEGDLTVAAQQIVLGGDVRDDARLAGQVITLESETNIGDDLVAGGFSLQCMEGSRVGGEVKFGGYQAEFDWRSDHAVDSQDLSMDSRNVVGPDHVPKTR